MMQQASFDFGFEAENIPLMIEAIPSSSDSIVLIITKVEDPEELDTRFSRFTPSGESDPLNIEALEKLEGADEFSRPLFGGHGCMDFSGDIARILFVEDVLYRQQYVIGMFLTVDTVGDSDKAYAHLRKTAFQISSGIDIITSKPREVFHRDTVYLPAPDIHEHLLKGGPFKS